MARSPSQGSGEVLALEALPGKRRSFGNRCPPRKVLALEALPVEFLAIEALPTECNRGSRRSASSRKPPPGLKTIAAIEFNTASQPVSFFRIFLLNLFFLIFFLNMKDIQVHW